MDLAWKMTSRTIEQTARAVVDQILGSSFASVAASDAPASEGSSAAAACPNAEFVARGDALILIGGIFSGEKAAHLREGLTKVLGKDGLSKLEIGKTQVRTFGLEKEGLGTGGEASLVGKGSHGTPAEGMKTAELLGKQIIKTNEQVAGLGTGGEVRLGTGCPKHE